MDSNTSFGSSDRMVQAVVWQEGPAAASVADDFEIVDQQNQQQQAQQQQQHQSFLSQSASEYYSDADDVVAATAEAVSTMMPNGPSTALQQRPTQPVCFRVLFTGNTGCSIGTLNRYKTAVLKKLSEVVACTLPRGGGGGGGTDAGTVLRNDEFRERTHNVVFLDAFDTSPIETYEDNGLHVVEADFTDERNDERRLVDYVDTHDVDLAVYLYSIRQQPVSTEHDMETLKLLSGRMPIWPLLLVPSAPERPLSATGYRPHPHHRHRSPMAYTMGRTSNFNSDAIATLGQSLSDLLAQHHVQTIDLPGINPEAPHFSPKAASPNVVLTVDQFAAIDRSQVAAILQRWHTASDSSRKGVHWRWCRWWYRWRQQWRQPQQQQQQRLRRRSFPYATVLAAAAAAAVTVMLLLLGSRFTSTAGRAFDVTKEPVQMRLNPMWDVVDEDTLRQLFVVEMDPERAHDAWKEQTLLVVLDTDQLAEKEFIMTYEPGTRYHYVVDVPSPCLVHNAGDISATVVWRYWQDARTKVERLVVDQAVLSLEACQPVYERHVTPECRSRTALTAVRRKAAAIEWRLLLGKIKHEFKKLAHDMSAACQSLLMRLLT